MEELIKRYNSLKQQQLIISNKEIRDIAKIFDSLKDSGQLIQGVTQTTVIIISFLSMLLGNLCLRLLENALSRKGVIVAGDAVIRADDGIKQGKDY